MKNVFWDIKTQFVPHRRHYVSTTEPSRLMLCKVWGFHGGDYEECRVLGYKNPVRTSQERHYVAVAEPSQLMQCNVWGFHGGDYEEFRLLRCGTVWVLEPTVRRIMSPPSSGSKAVSRSYHCRSRCLLLVTLLEVRGFFPPWRWIQHAPPKRRL
jgi:hypothetical protein